MSSLPTLVTGGTGFIGRHLVGQLLDRGVTVRILARSPDKAHRLFGNRVEVSVGDLTRAADVDAACRGIGRVYHLGGLYRFGARHRHELWHCNVVGTSHVLASCRRLRIEQLIHCSTAGVLKSRNELRTPHDFPPAPPPGCPYKQSKWQAERLVLEAARDGLPVVIASPTAPLGAGDEEPTPTGRMVLDVLRGRIPVCTRTGLNVVAVEDCAGGLIATAEKGTPGNRYLLGGVNLWLLDLLREIARQGGVRPPRALIPWVLVVAGGALADAWSLLGGPSDDRLCWETGWFAGQRQFFDLAPTRKEIGWQAERTLAVTVAAAVSWFREFPGVEAPKPDPIGRPDASP